MNHLALARANYLAIRERVRAEEKDLDEQTLADTVEGLTDLHDIVAALAGGLKDRIKEMQERLERMEDRASKRRQIARDVMTEMGIKKLTQPDFTVSIRPGSPSLAVIDEAQIPAEYWEPREPRLNRQALLTELKAGVEIAGTSLSNSELVLSVRSR
jgi:phage host-nuclease inhibitor protein Gam